MPAANPFSSALQTIDTPLGQRNIYGLDALPIPGVENLPYCIKVLLESCLRKQDEFIVTQQHVRAVAGYDARNVGQVEVPFTPGRVLLQDFTGVPAVVDLAAMRDAIVRMTGRRDAARKVNPLVPCDLVIDHSVQVDAFASGMALTINNERDFERNNERYGFLKWGQKAFNNFRVVPPATGICHQVNLEYLAKVVWEAPADGQPAARRGATASQAAVLYPDSLVGTDSHTTMINGLGVVGWGVGGIEAEAVMLGQPIYMLLPEVVGFQITGKLPEGATGTDLVLTVTQMLRSHGVVNKFVEFWGDGLAGMPVAVRATIANMAPEYGATIGYFPVDDQTLSYLRLTGRDEKLVKTVELYCKRQKLWREPQRRITYSSNLALDLSTVEPSLAGPRRPQDRVQLSNMRSQWRSDLGTVYGKPGTGKPSPLAKWESEGGQTARSSAAVAIAEPQVEGVQVSYDGQTFTLRHGSVVIAAITSCTNTSNPEVMLGAGLLARKAVEKGLSRKPWVKTSLAPGSAVVTKYLKDAGLLSPLESLGFHLVGYGCTTCIGNSGPLPEPISKAVNGNDLVVASVLSGNRNFEGRIHPDCKANYLASPPLVVAYALAGTVDIDLYADPIGKDRRGDPVYLRDIWPSQEEIDRAVSGFVTREQFIEQYRNVFDGPEEWRKIAVGGGELFEWSDDSTYIQNPPFFEDLISHDSTGVGGAPIRGARCLVKVGDSVTTDHISPAGSIKPDSPAGQFLISKGVPVSMFNSYGARRGNDRVMTRGTFANIRVKNELAGGREGGWTRFLGAPHANGAPRAAPQPHTTLEVGQITTIYEASVAYKALGVPLIVIAGKDYGMGSSRDWAAKGTFLLGVKAVIAESFERIHRSNLVGMGVLPLTFKPGENARVLGLDGTETFDVELPAGLKPRQEIRIIVRRFVQESSLTGRSLHAGEFVTLSRIDTPVEVDYYRNGGILHTVLKRMAQA